MFEADWAEASVWAEKDELILVSWVPEKIWDEATLAFPLLLVVEFSELVLVSTAEIFALNETVSSSITIFGSGIKVRIGTLVVRVDASPSPLI